eukprot:1148629-Pyramimonas_sp.AAC.1
MARRVGAVRKERGGGGGGGGASWRRLDQHAHGGCRQPPAGQFLLVTLGNRPFLAGRGRSQGLPRGREVIRASRFAVL